MKSWKETSNKFCAWQNAMNATMSTNLWLTCTCLCAWSFNEKGERTPRAVVSQWTVQSFLAREFANDGLGICLECDAIDSLGTRHKRCHTIGNFLTTPRTQPSLVGFKREAERRTCQIGKTGQIGAFPDRRFGIRSDRNGLIESLNCHWSVPQDKSHAELHGKTSNQKDSKRRRTC